MSRGESHFSFVVYSPIEENSHLLVNVEFPFFYFKLNVVNKISFSRLKKVLAAVFFFPQHFSMTAHVDRTK